MINSFIITLFYDVYKFRFVHLTSTLPYRNKKGALLLRSPFEKLLNGEEKLILNPCSFESFHVGAVTVVECVVPSSFVPKNNSKFSMI